MNIIRHNPWNWVGGLHREADRSFATQLAADTAQKHDGYLPAVDIREQDDRFVISADLPGVDPTDLDITVEDGTLSIRGKRESHGETETDGLVRRERASGRFLRRFQLPDTAADDRVSAEYRNGVLAVSVPKLARKQPRRIEVTAN